MGAHSGTSSDDLVLMIAYYDNNSGIVLNTGLERHGIKSMVFPSQVYEQSVTYFKMYLITYLCILIMSMNK